MNRLHTLSAALAAFAVAGTQAQTIRYELRNAATGAPVENAARSTTQAACDTLARARADGGEYHCHRLTIAPRSAPAPTPAPAPPAPAPAPAPSPAPSPAPAPAPAPAQLPQPVHLNACPPSTIPGNAQGTWLAGPDQECPALRFAGVNGMPDMTKRVHVGSMDPSRPGVIRVLGSGKAIEFGGYAEGLPQNTTRTANITIANLKLIDNGTTSLWGAHVKGDTFNVRLESIEASGFERGVHWQGTAATTGSALVNSYLHHNRGDGLLGTPLTVEGNTFAFNNSSGSPLYHGAYLGSSGYVSRNVTIRGNTFLDNSIGAGGRCTGGNLTLHGQFDGVLVEKNTVRQTRGSNGGCYGMSITPAYAAAESFLNLVVQDNTIEGTGGHTIAIASAPGAIVRRNRSINGGTIGQGIPPGAGDYDDRADGTKVFEDNCGAIIVIPGRLSGNTAACAP